jgi:hypothetical protein
MGISDKKKASNKRWDDANKERIKYLKMKSAAKSFIKIAEINDIEILKEWLEEREKEINS